MISKLIIPAKMLFPNKVTFPSTGVRVGGGGGELQHIFLENRI